MKIWITSSSKVEDGKYLELARKVATHFYNKKDEVLCGGISSSMMREIYNVYENDSDLLTVCTLDCYRENLEKVKNIIIVESTFDRSKYLYELADEVVFLPGGSGSLSEIFASLEEHRTFASPKKMILYNYDGFFDKLTGYINDLIDEGFNDISILDHLQVVSSIDELEKKVSENNEQIDNGKTGKLM